MNDAIRIEHDGKVLAIILKKDIEVETNKPKFFTPDEYPLQMGIMVHEAGSSIKPHMHKSVEKIIKQTQEMLRIDFGRVDIDFYSEAGDKFETITLEAGDTILFVSGGHGFRFQEKTKMTEIKQGPYGGVNVDKEILMDVE